MIRYILRSTIVLVCALHASAAEPTRPVSEATVAWWTFDNHLRDEVRDLTLKNTLNEREDLETFYQSIQFVDDVPILRLYGQLNWRGYYRWGQPNLTRGEMGDELDLSGPFTIEAYLNPRAYPGQPPQTRAFVLRKNRLHDAKSQWRIEVRRDDESGERRADLWVAVAFQMPNGETAVTEATARDAVKLEAWQHFAVVFDGEQLSILLDHRLVTNVEGAGGGARPLPSEGKSEMLVSSIAGKDADGKPYSKDERYRSTVFGGRIDELRISSTALSSDQFLPLPRGLGQEPLPDPPRREEYTSIVRRHLDFLLAHGTDRYGPVRSPLIGSTLDPDAKAMLKLKPPRVPGMPFVGDTYRSPIYGCNLTLMRHTLMAMRSLSAVTGDGRYQEHANRAIRFWLDTCIHPSGVWPVGEHGVWNFYTDEPDMSRAHEPQALLDWPRYWALAPEKVREELELMHRLHVFPYEYNGKTLAFHGRHGNSKGSAHGVGGCGFIRQSGLFGRAWAFLYSKTKNPEHLRWARDQLDLMWELRDPKTDLCPTQIFPPPGATFGGRKYPARIGCGTQPIWSAIGFLDATQWLDDPADRKLFFDRAVPLAVANFKVYYKWNGKRFTDPRLRWNSSTHMPGGGWLLMKVWERAGKPSLLLDQAKRVADERMKNWRPLKTTDAGRYGWNIMFFVQLHNETGEQKYLDFARRLGDYASANLVSPQGLVVGSCHYRYYDRMYHVPKLTQALLALDHPRHPAVEPLLREPYF